MSDLYKQNIVDHIDDYRFFNKANVDGDLKKALNTVDSLTTDTFASESSASGKGSVKDLEQEEENETLDEISPLELKNHQRLFSNQSSITGK